MRRLVASVVSFSIGPYASSIAAVSYFSFFADDFLSGWLAAVALASLDVHPILNDLNF